MDILKQELDKYRYIIFDFDGTIVDLYVDWKKLKNELSKTFNLDFSILNVGLKRLNRDELKIAFKIIEKYESCANYKANLRLVNYIRTNNKKYAIFSDNMTSTIQRILRELGIKNRFEIIVGKDSVKNFKPNVEGLVKILKYFNVDNLREVIYVGDSEKDKIIAKKANIKFLNIKKLWR